MRIVGKQQQRQLKLCSDWDGNGNDSDDNDDNDDGGDGSGSSKAFAILQGLIKLEIKPNCDNI